MVRYQLRPGCSGPCSALQTSMEGDGTESLGYLLCYLLASQSESPSSQSAWTFFCFSFTTWHSPAKHQCKGPALPAPGSACRPWQFASELEDVWSTVCLFYLCPSWMLHNSMWNSIYIEQDALEHPWVFFIFKFQASINSDFMGGISMQCFFFHPSSWVCVKEMRKK